MKETKSDSKPQILFSSHELLNKAEQEAVLARGSPSRRMREYLWELIYYFSNIYSSLALRKHQDQEKEQHLRTKDRFPQTREQAQIVITAGRWMNGNGRGCVRLRKLQSKLALPAQRGSLWGRSAFKPTVQHVGKLPRADISLGCAHCRKTG